MKQGDKFMVEHPRTGKWNVEVNKIYWCDFNLEFKAFLKCNKVDDESILHQEHVSGEDFLNHYLEHKIN